MLRMRRRLGDEVGLVVNQGLVSRSYPPNRLSHLPIPNCRANILLVGALVPDFGGKGIHGNLKIIERCPIQRERAAQINVER